MGNVDSAAVRTTRREKRQQAREEVMEDDDDDCSSIDECQPLISRTRSSRRENEGEYTDEKYQEEAASPTNTAPAKQHLFYNYDPIHTIPHTHPNAWYERASKNQVTNSFPSASTVKLTLFCGNRHPRIYCRIVR